MRNISYSAWPSAVDGDRGSSRLEVSLTLRALPEDLERLAGLFCE